MSSGTRDIRLKGAGFLSTSGGAIAAAAVETEFGTGDALLSLRSFFKFAMMLAPNELPNADVSPLPMTGGTGEDEPDVAERDASGGREECTVGLSRPEEDDDDDDACAEFANNADTRGDDDDPPAAAAEAEDEAAAVVVCVDADANVAAAASLTERAFGEAGTGEGGVGGVGSSSSVSVGGVKAARVA